MPFHLQLWSYNYAPEPTGIGPVSTVWAEAMAGRGHHVEVVAAHPHYPSPQWGRRLRPYREERNGISVLRLPLWVGRATAGERIRQELTFMCAQLAALPALGRPDIVVVVSPSFPALVPALVNARLRRLPWVLWLHDILPEGAASTGIVESGSILRAAGFLERTAYREARQIVVLSKAFAENLREKGVAETKLRLIYPPATRSPPADPGPNGGPDNPRILSMGNIGYSQGLAPLVRAFESAEDDEAPGAHLIITGSGVAAEDVRSEVKSERVEMLGLVTNEELERELRQARLALVSQAHAGTEFNLPSKLMNFMAYGLPVVAVVDPSSEVARILEASNGGWVVDSGRPDCFPRKVREVLADPAELERRGRAASEYARDHFTVDRFAQRFEDVLLEAAQASPTESKRPEERLPRE